MIEAWTQQNNHKTKGEVTKGTALHKILIGIGKRYVTPANKIETVLNLQT